MLSVTSMTNPRVPFRSFRQMDCLDVTSAPSRANFPRPRTQPLPFPHPAAGSPIWLSSVYRCHDPQQAEAMLAGTLPGYVYSREGHPNAQLLADKCRALHGAEQGAVVASGMAALATVLLARCRQGDHVVVSDQLYGRSHALFVDEAARLGIASTIVDATDLKATAAALTNHTKLLLVETISNPLLRVADLAGLAEIAHRSGAKLVVDNTFASPALCRPLDLGAGFGRRKPHENHERP